jgi:hypothetical protein
MKYGGVKGLNFSTVTSDGTSITFLDPHAKFSSLVEDKNGEVNKLDFHFLFSNKPGTATTPPPMSGSRINEHMPTHKVTITAAGKVARKAPEMEIEEL